MILCCWGSCMPRVLRISLLLNVVRKPNSSRIAFSLKVLFPSATGKIAKISDAADILGVYIIYQIVGHSALSQWSRKELATLPCSPKTPRRKGVTWLWHRPALEENSGGPLWLCRSAEARETPMVTLSTKESLGSEIGMYSLSSPGGSVVRIGLLVQELQETWV